MIPVRDAGGKGDHAVGVHLARRAKGRTGAYTVLRRARREGAMGEFSPWHWLLVLLIALLLFGPRKLPEIGKGLGSAIRGFKEALRGDEPPPGPGATEQKSSEAAKPPLAEGGPQKS